MDISKDSSGKRRTGRKNKGQKDIDPSFFEDIQETQTLAESEGKGFFTFENPKLSGFGMVLPPSGKKETPHKGNKDVLHSGTQEYHDYLKRQTAAWLSEPRFNPYPEIKDPFDEAVGGAVVYNNTLVPPANEQKPTRPKSSRASVVLSKVSTASSLAVRKKEEEVKTFKAKSEILKKIREIDSVIMTKELKINKSKNEVRRLNEVYDRSPADTEEKQKEREDEIKSKELAIELEQEEFDIEKKIKLLQKDALEDEIKGIEKEAELAQAKLDEENDQRLSDEEEEGGSSEDENQERIETWADSSVAEKLKEHLRLKAQKQAEQQRVEDEKLAEKRQQIMLEFQREKLKAEAAFKVHQELQATKLEEILKMNEPKSHTVPTQQARRIPSAPVLEPTTTSVFNPYAIPFSNPFSSHQAVPIHTQFLARQSHGKDLPFFSGNPEEWLTFKGAYERTQQVCGFSPDENLNRLQKCLKGDAAKFVQSLMTTPNNVPSIMKKLELRFGQPEYIIDAMTVRVRNTPVLKQDNSDGIIEFGGAVDNLVTTLQALKRPDHLHNPTLLKELELKMPLSWQIEWREWLNREDKTKDLSAFAEWLEGKTTIVCQLCPPKATGHNEKKTEGNQHFRNRRSRERVMLAVDVQQNNNGRDNKSRTCLCCSIMGHRIWNCTKFKEMNPQERNNFVKNKRLCEVCLSFGHRTSDCRSSRLCGKEGCRGRHNFLLHLGRRRPGAVPPERQPRAPEGQPRSPEGQPRAPEGQQRAPEQQQRPLEGAYHASNIEETDQGRVIYKILPLTFIGPNGEEIDDFIFMDGASGITILDNGIAEELHLKRQSKPFKFEGLGYTGNRPNSCANFQFDQNTPAKFII